MFSIKLDWYQGGLTVLWEGINFVDFLRSQKCFFMVPYQGYDGNLVLKPIFRPILMEKVVKNDIFLIMI